MMANAFAFLDPNEEIKLPVVRCDNKLLASTGEAFPPSMECHLLKSSSDKKNNNFLLKPETYKDILIVGASVSDGYKTESGYGPAQRFINELAISNSVTNKAIPNKTSWEI